MSQQRIGSLDNLRGIAALLVVWIHATGYLAAVSDEDSSAHAWHTLFDQAALGRIGVVVFFLLSGYLIGLGSLRQDWHRGFPLKRVFRLYPAFLVSLILVCLQPNIQPSVGTVLANLSMLPTLFGKAELLAIYWTLETEILFYLVFYTIFRLKLVTTQAGLWTISTICTAIFAASQILLPEEILRSLPLLLERLPQHFGYMFLGGYIARGSQSDLPNRGVLSLCLINLVPPLFVLGEYVVGHLAVYPSASVAYLVSTALFFVTLTLSPRSLIMERVGRISYSLYLLHPLVIEHSYRFLRHLPDLPLPLILGGFLVLSLVVSEFSFRLVENPAIRLSRALAKRR